MFRFGIDAQPTTLRPYLIDQFEVSAAQAALFLNSRGSNACPGLDIVPSTAGDNECVKGIGLRSTALLERDGSFVVQEGFEDTAPMTFSWEGAMQYCAWVGKQVPSSAQWEFAGRHDPRLGNDLRFPWGNEWQPTASCWQFAGCGDPPKPAHGTSWRGLFDGTRGRGDGSSPWGVHDLVGGAPELMFHCADPNETCHAGRVCTCQPEEMPQDGLQERDLELTSRKRWSEQSGLHGLRCVYVPRRAR